MENVITKRQLLLEVLQDYERRLRGLSKSGRMIEAKEGKDEQFNAYLIRCQGLREMIQAMESEPVRRSIANWQKELMEGKRPDIRELDPVRVKYE